MVDINEIKEALVAVDADRLTERVRAGLDDGLAAKDILNRGLIEAMNIVGEKMESGDLFIPEVLMCAVAMKQAVGLLQPFLSVEDARSAGKMAIGTVKGDLHDIGKNLVGMMLESGGFEIVDLGVDIAPETFVAAIREHQPQILGLSALLTTTMPMLQQTIAAIEAAGLRSAVKIVVGGAPVTRNYAEQIGADGYAPDAGSALKLVRGLKDGLSPSIKGDDHADHRGTDQRQQEGHQGGH